MSTDTSQSALVDDLVAEFRESLSRRGLHDGTVRPYAQGARYFVVRLENDGALLAGADDGLLQRFARHSCECAGFADRKWPARTPHLSASGAVRFVRFLEARDLVRHPGELAGASAWRKRSRNPCAPKASSRPPPMPTGTHSLTLRPLAAPVQDPVRPGQRRCGGAFCRSRLPVPGTAVASPSQAVPRPEGRSESFPFCRLPGRGRCPGRRTCAPAHAAGRASSRSGSGCCGIGDRGVQRGLVLAHPAGGTLALTITSLSP